MLESSQETEASLYIHIPFCSSFCDYCDFYSVLTDNYSNDFFDTYISALISDIRFQIDYFKIKKIPTVYIGGGTPSVLGKKIKLLLDILNEIQGFNPVEFTIEANPESITEEFLSVCKEGGINRLSLGVQTFHEPSRTSVNRLNGYSQIKSGLSLAMKYFPDSLSVDLITGLPFQDETIIKEDIKKILDFNPQHVSLYALITEAGTSLEEKVKLKTVILPQDDFADSLWFAGQNALINEGYENYEISNFAKNFKYSLHNKRYWEMKNWIGAGPSASGTIIDEKTGTAVRYTYSNDIKKYINKPCITEAGSEELDKRTLINDVLLMGCRCKDGPDSVLFKNRFGKSLNEYIPQTLENWKDRDKTVFLNQFLREAFKELEITIV